MKTLKEIKVGEMAIINNIKAKGQLRQRIMDMGITKGTKVKLIKVAPLGDPMEFSLRGYNLYLRKNDAKLIEIEREN